MKKVFFIALMSLAFIQIGAQTYCYKVLHNVTTEGVKVKGMVQGALFYFTFNGNKSMCYMTDKDGIYSGGPWGDNSYKYIGTQDDIHIYQDASTNMLSTKGNWLFFSKDFKILNWRCTIDDYGYTLPKGSLRVMRYIENPNKVEAPSVLY